MKYDLINIGDYFVFDEKLCYKMNRERRISR